MFGIRLNILGFFLIESFSRQVVLGVVVSIRARPAHVVLDQRSHNHIEILGAIRKESVLSCDKVAV